MSAFLADEFDEPHTVLEGHDGWGLVSTTAGLARRECGLAVVRDRAPNAPRGHVYVVGKKTKSVTHSLATQAKEVIPPSPPPR